MFCSIDSCQKGIRWLVSHDCIVGSGIEVTYVLKVIRWPVCGFQLNAGSSLFFKGGIQFAFSSREKVKYLRKSFLTRSLESFAFGLGWAVHMNVSLQSETQAARKNSMTSCLQVQNPDALPLSYKKLVGAKVNKLQWATKWVETLRPETGRFYVLLTSKGGKITFPPPSPPCNVVPLFELPIENNKHPNFE